MQHKVLHSVSLYFWQNFKSFCRHPRGVSLSDSLCHLTANATPQNSIWKIWTSILNLRVYGETRVIGHTYTPITLSPLVAAEQLPGKLRWQDRHYYHSRYATRYYLFVVAGKHLPKSQTRRDVVLLKISVHFSCWSIQHKFSTWRPQRR